ncbi:unnamed protein product [Aphanomyces euteiches]|uniref:SAP domain-containing protein n=1 Tax=Aphanomyces euteiches TaxID=100861 RepID=A0A6G0WMU7_9STRA|nr:hypothetical protein Ae201684_013605 [Aphanomyces euteiches]KAH9094049.1 hypothetical protein Ae201684P_016665 [Aphanomyces euteiches]KAH9138363.1 hypothetical protein AeRB84_017319 [Aphanomyces euteiches]
MDPEDVKKMTVKQLQESLGSFNLDKKGVKAELQARLLKHLELSKGESSEAATEAGTTVDPVEENDTVSSNDNVKLEITSPKATMQATEDKGTAAWTEVSVKTEPEETIKIKEEENEVAVKVEPTDTTSTKRTGETLTADVNRAAKKPKTTPSSKTGNGPTCTLRISNFIRPFTLNAVKDFVQQEGNFVENGFWMDSIKTHCYVTYPSIEIAEKMKEFVHDRVWPERSGRKLAVEYSVETASDITEKHQQQLQKQQATPRQRETKAAVDANPVVKVAKETKVLKPPVTMSELFLKTETKPVLFYLPVSEELVAERKATLDTERKSPAGVVGRPQRRRKRRGGRFRR